MKVVDASHESRGHKPSQHVDVCDIIHNKPVCVTLMEFSPLQYTAKVRDKVRDKVQITKVRDMNHESRQHYLYLRLSPRGSFGESRKVGLMEFGLN